MSIGRNLVRMEMPAGLTTLYTVPKAKIAEIKTITTVNRDSTNPAKWFLYLVKDGDVADNSNVLIPGTDQWDIPDGRNIDYETWKVLDAETTIQGYSTGQVTIHIDGALVDA